MKYKLCYQGGLVSLNDNPLNAGGEGAIYTLKEKFHASSVVKIYHNNRKPNADKTQKLDTLVRLSRLGNIDPHLVLPKDLLIDTSGQIAGILLDKVNDHLTLSQIYHPSTRLDYNCYFDFRDLLNIVIELSRLVESAHSQNIVIGDLNHNNVVITTAKKVYLIDLDSIQVEFNGRLFFCEVGMPEFLPSELQKVTLSKTKRLASSDNFSLAVLLFFVLYQGVHPYDGVVKNGQNMTRGEKISSDKWHRFSINNKTITPPQLLGSVIPLNIANDRLIRLFLRSFNTDAVGRPNASEYFAALLDYQDQLSTCSNLKNHYFPPSMNICPWCEARSKGFICFPKPPRSLKDQIEGFTEAIKKQREKRLAGYYIPLIGKHDHTNAFAAAIQMKKRLIKGA